MFKVSNKETKTTPLMPLKRVFVFPGPSPLLGPWPPICIYHPWPPIGLYWPWPLICIYRSWASIYIYRPWSPICIYRPWPQIFIYRPCPVRNLGLHKPILSPQFVLTGPGLRSVLPCSEFAFTFLFVVAAVVVVILAIVVISLD